MVSAIEKLIGSSYMLGLIHAEEENPERKIEAADETEIPEIPFNEAMQFLKSKVPMSKVEWKKLEPKLRFRAFTVANISSLDMIESMKHVLIGALEKGESYSDTWETLKNIADDDAMKIRPGLWESIFRTNTQSAYIAGKLQQYENTNVAAYQLMVIEDGRTSKICRHLLTASGYGMIISVDHPFWKKYGFPPYHFQCRTSIRAIWPSQVGKLGNMVENPTMKSLSKFKPQDGFGGNPLDNGNWWMMTPQQMERAIKYGCLNRFSREENIFADYDKVWNGYTRHEGKNGGWYDLCKNPPDDWEGGEHPGKPIIDFLVENGYKIKVLPDIQNIPEKYHIKWSNPDILINGFLADIKTVESSIVSRLKSAKNQHVSHVVLKVPDTFTEDDIDAGFQKFKKDYHTYMDILYIYKNQIFHKIIQA